MRFVSWLLPGVWLCITAPILFAQTTEIDIPTAKRLGAALIAEGQNQAAFQILVTLAERQPDDPEILIHLSRAQRNLGFLTDAATTGRRAFRNAASKEQKFAAARVTAQALASAGDRTAAQIWLRRAGNHAPNAQAEAVIRSEYRYVRSRNPVSFAFDLSISPTDNINDAPTSTQLRLGPLIIIDPTVQPISGVEYATSVYGTYRFPASATAQNQVTLGWVRRRVTLGDDAATINPSLDASDFDHDRILLGWSGKFRADGKQNVFDADTWVFADEYAGEHIQNGIAISGGHTWYLDAKRAFRAGILYENLDRLDVPVRSSQTWRLSGDWTWITKGGNRFGLGLTVADTQSDSANIANAAQSIEVRYDFAKPWMSANWALSAEYEYTLFDSQVDVLLDRRRDEAWTLRAEAAFGDLKLYGFAPVVDLTYERTHSNIETFDIRATEVGFSLRSTY